MEKIDLPRFRVLKQQQQDIIKEIMDLLNILQEATSDEEIIRKQLEFDQSIVKMKGIIENLLQYDLSDIDFEEWRGMCLVADEDNPLDFSKTKANLDFSIIHYEYDKGIVNFKGCKIKNFDFQKKHYKPEMFDEDFINANPEYFLSNNIPQDVSDRFYQGKLSLEDIRDNPELFDKIGEKNLGFNLREMYSLIGRDELCKLDARFVDITSHRSLQVLKNNPQLKKAEEIMPVLYEEERKYILGNRSFDGSSIDELGDGFKKQNPDLYLSEDVPIYIRQRYYTKQLLFKDFSENLQYFRGKKVRWAFKSSKEIYGLEKIFSIYGEYGTYQLFEKYKPIMDEVCSRSLEWIDDIYIPSGEITEEQKKQIMSSIIQRCNRKRDVRQQGNFFNDFNKLNMLTDFISLDEIPIPNEAKKILQKYDKDKLKEVEFVFLYLLNNKKVTNIQELKRLDAVLEYGDLMALVEPDYRNIIKLYGIDTLLEIGIEDLDRVLFTNNIVWDFYNQFGKEEFLKICADYGKYQINIDLSNESNVSIERFRQIIEQAIYNEIKENGMEYSEEIPLSFQKEHPELFLPKDIDEELRNKFYKGLLTFEDIRKNPQIKDLLLTKDISVGFGKTKYDKSVLDRGGHRDVKPMWKILSEQEIIDFAEKYGKYFDEINQSIFELGQSLEEREEAVKKNIEENIINRISSYDENVPGFFKQKYPEMFLDENAPEDLKKVFYDNSASRDTEPNISGETTDINFTIIKEHPEWKVFLQGKDLSRAFSRKYSEMFKRFDSSTLMRLGTKNPETIEEMVDNEAEELLENWYKSTGGKFVPHHVVMLEFPKGEIDSFLRNSKRWSQLMRINKGNLNNDDKTAILKIAYVMGVFQGYDDGFNNTMKLFTDVPRKLTKKEYDSVFSYLKDEESKNLFQKAYTLSFDGSYVFSMDKQKNKDSVREIRRMLEGAQIPRILTLEKAHQMFNLFSMEYNSGFVTFINDNIEKILSDPKYIKNIAIIQRCFSKILKVNAGRRLTLDVAQDYVDKRKEYIGVDIGNENVAEHAQIAGYSQEDFEEIQKLFNEGEVRDFSSIPRVQGEINGFTYEILRCDDPLALVIGDLTNCCQKIHKAGATSMEHSVVSADGRVLCVRDEEGKIVAQSWVWRNQYTCCFDNIEIPKQIIKFYKKKKPDIGVKGLTDRVLAVYKKAAQDLMQEDARVYQELLENGTITEEQYNALLLGKVTIGLGFNNIAEAILNDKTIKIDNDRVDVKGTDRLPSPYTDAKLQYIIAEREGIVKSTYENLYIHQDDVAVYDCTNMSGTVLSTIKRMKQVAEETNLTYLGGIGDTDNFPESQEIINSIAREYGLNSNDTKVMATARVVLIYSQDKENKIKISDLLFSPLKEGMTEKQKQEYKAHIMYQVKKIIKQIGVDESKVDLSLLSEEQRGILQSIMNEIEKELRGER